MPGYNPNTNNLGFGGSPVSGITQFAGAEDFTSPATDKAALAISAAADALKGTTANQGTLQVPGAGTDIGTPQTTTTPPVVPAPGTTKAPLGPPQSFADILKAAGATPEQIAATESYYAGPHSNLANINPADYGMTGSVDTGIYGTVWYDPLATYRNTAPAGVDLFGGRYAPLPGARPSAMSQG